MLFSLLELASNKALEYDASTLARLEKLQGKVMTLHIKDFDQSITVSPQSEGLEFNSLPPEQADVTLSTTLAAMIKIGRDGIENADLKTGELEMNGDPIVGQRFAQMMGDLNIDWEALLAERIGEAPAKAATTVAGHAQEFIKESRGQLHTFVSDLITKDMQIVANAGEVEEFLDDVDNLRADVDQLSARLSAILKKID